MRKLEISVIVILTDKSKIAYEIRPYEKIYSSSIHIQSL